MYVYLNSDPGLYTVGFYDPKGKWEAESDHTSRIEAAQRVAYLNGNTAGEDFRKAVDRAYQQGFDAGRGLKV